MAWKMKSTDYFILAAICAGISIYDFFQYQNANLIFERNCDSALELLLWSDQCVMLLEQMQTIQLEIAISTMGFLLFAAIGFKKDDSSEDYSTGYSYDFGDEEDDKWPLWFSIVFGILCFILLMAALLASIEMGLIPKA